MFCFFNNFTIRFSTIVKTIGKKGRTQIPERNKLQTKQKTTCHTNRTKFKQNLKNKIHVGTWSQTAVSFACFQMSHRYTPLSSAGMFLLNEKPSSIMQDTCYNKGLETYNKMLLIKIPVVMVITSQPMLCIIFMGECSVQTNKSTTHVIRLRPINFINVSRKESRLYSLVIKRKLWLTKNNISN